jgi:hypothetical protein
MNAHTLRRNRTRRASARSAAAFWREAGAWAGVVVLAVVGLPVVVLVGLAMGHALA